MAKATAESKKNKLLTYKNKPLMRCGNIIYYGNIEEKYIVMLQIIETKKVKDLSVATKVAVQLQSVDPNAKNKNRVVKSSEKNGLYAAMDIGAIWLERALTSD